MRPLFEQAAPSWDNGLFYEYWVDLVHSIPTMVAFRDDRYKLIRYPEITDLDELYDLQEDPYELRNLAADEAHAGLHREMAARLRAAAADVGWSPQNFPRNLDRIRGPKGLLLDLVAADGEVTDRAGSGRAFSASGVTVADQALNFDGRSSAITVPFDP
jgi:hypothetical protein